MLKRLMVGGALCALLGVSSWYVWRLPTSSPEASLGLGEKVSSATEAHVVSDIRVIPPFPERRSQSWLRTELDNVLGSDDSAKHLDSLCVLLTREEFSDLAQFVEAEERIISNDRLLSVFVEAWAAVNGVEATAFIYEAYKRNNSLVLPVMTAFNAWTTTEPIKASMTVDEFPVEDLTWRFYAIEGIAAGLNASMPEYAREWASKERGGEESMFIEALSQSVVAAEFADHGAWLSSLIRAGVNARAGVHLFARKYGEHSPEKALSWALNFHHGDDNIAAVSGVTQTAILKDPALVVEVYDQWLSSSPHVLHEELLDTFYTASKSAFGLTWFSSEEAIFSRDDVQQYVQNRVLLEERALAETVQ